MARFPSMAAAVGDGRGRGRRRAAVAELGVAGRGRVVSYWVWSRNNPF
jgi:hypothetical protein